MSLFTKLTKTISDRTRRRWRKIEQIINYFRCDLNKAKTWQQQQQQQKREQIFNLIFTISLMSIEMSKIWCRWSSLNCRCQLPNDTGECESEIISTCFELIRFDHFHWIMDIENSHKLIPGLPFISEIYVFLQKYPFKLDILHIQIVRFE